MNPSPSDTAIMLPSDFERQQIFYWLQKVSSVTAWRRIFTYYTAWADATEQSVRDADERGWGGQTALPQSEYVFVLKGLAHCEEGVNRLAKGDKTVFKFDANGEFAMARRALFHWAEMLSRIELGENSIDEPHTPRWPRFCETLTSAGQAWQECARHVLEPQYLDEPGRTLYGDWLKATLKALPFPSPLPPVPDPVDNTFVHTGDYAPCSGIWEPIDAPKPTLMSLITRAPKPQAPFMIVGAMNYLHGGSKAPQITLESANDSVDRDTTWRLLWRDDRYHDGTVPAIEAHYRFTEPEPAPAQRAVYAGTAELVCENSGTAVRNGGKWLVESDLTASVVLHIGDKLPLHQGREVRWVLAAQ